MSKITITTTFLIFVICTAQISYGTQILSWEDCLTEAKQNHPDLMESKASVEEAEAQKAIIQTNLLPHISGSMNTATSKNSESYSAGIQGEQLIYNGKKTSYELLSANESIKSAAYDYNVTASNIRLRLRSAFVYLMKSQKLLNVTKAIALRRKQNMHLVKLRYEGGREHKGSLLTAEANYSQSIFDVAQAKRNIQLSQRQLTKELGRREKEDITAQGDFKTREFHVSEPDYENLAESNPFLQALIVRKEAARYDIQSSRADYLPQVYASGSTGVNDTSWPPNENTWSIGLRASVPVFEGGLQAANVTKAKAAFNRVAASERTGRDSIIYTLAETWTTFQNSIQQIAVQEKFLNAALERAKIAEAEYSNGLIGFDNWIIIEDDLVNARKRLLDAQANALLAEANWIQAKGGTLDYDKK